MITNTVHSWQDMASDHYIRVKGMEVGEDGVEMVEPLVSTTRAHPGVIYPCCLAVYMIYIYPARHTWSPYDAHSQNLSKTIET